MGGSRDQSGTELLREMQEYQDLKDSLEGMITGHQFPYHMKQRVLAHLSAVDESAIQRRMVMEQTSGVSLWKRSARKQAFAEGRRLAEEEIHRAREAALTSQTAVQVILDEDWTKLITNNRDAVISALMRQFLDGRGNPRVLPVDCQGGRATLVMLMINENDLPHELPSTTPTGIKTLKKLNASGRANFYRQWMSSSILGAMRCAFAEAPGLTAVTVVVVKKGPRDPFGEQSLDVIYSGTYERERFHQIKFMEPEALDAILYADDVRVSVKANSQVLQPLDLSQHPDLVAIISETDTLQWLQADPLRPGNP